MRENPLGCVLWIPVVLFFLIFIFVAYDYSQRSAAVVNDLKSLTDPVNEKARQEAISLRIENERKSIFVLTLLANFSAAIALIAAGTGAWVAFNKHMSDRHDARIDRAAKEFNELWAGVANHDTRIQVGSVAGIQHFLSAAKVEFHPRVAAALAAVGRHKNELVVVATITPAIEQAFRIVSLNVLRTMSWQGLKVYKANFSGLDLSGMDFRDAQLEEVNFADAKLVGTRFDAAILKGAVFDRADLQRSVLDYADLAGASLKNANLTDASARDASPGCRFPRGQAPL